MTTLFVEQSELSMLQFVASLCDFVLLKYIPKSEESMDFLVSRLPQRGLSQGMAVVRGLDRRVAGTKIVWGATKMADTVHALVNISNHDE